MQIERVQELWNVVESCALYILKETYSVFVGVYSVG